MDDAQYFENVDKDVIDLLLKNQKNPLVTQDIKGELNRGEIL